MESMLQARPGPGPAPHPAPSLRSLLFFTSSATTYYPLPFSALRFLSYLPNASNTRSINPNNSISISLLTSPSSIDSSSPKNWNQQKRDTQKKTDRQRSSVREISHHCDLNRSIEPRSSSIIISVLTSPSSILILVRLNSGIQHRQKTQTNDDHQSARQEVRIQPSTWMNHCHRRLVGQLLVLTFTR